MKILKSRNRGYGREPAWIGSVPMLEFSGFPSLPVLADFRHGRCDFHFFHGFLAAKSLAFSERGLERACSVNLAS